MTTPKKTLLPFMDDLGGSKERKSAEAAHSRVDELLSIADPIERAQARLGLILRDYQREAVEHLISGNNTIVHIPTGRGKSLIFQSAAVALKSKGLTVVVYPLKALMKDQAESAKRRGLNIIKIDGDLKRSDRALELERIQDPSVDMLLTNPESIMASKALRDAIYKRGVSLFAIDEAHVYDEWVPAFRGAYARLGFVIKGLNFPTILLCSATITAQGAADAVKSLGVYNWKVVKLRAIRENLIFSDLPTKMDAFIANAAKNSLPSHMQAPGIVYFSWASSVNNARDALVKHYKADILTYTGQMSSKLRNSNQDVWMQGKRFILATKAFGMGIDKANVRTIVHAQLPSSALDYAQEVGRGGRDGLPTYCYLPRRDYMGFEEKSLGSAASFLISKTFPTRKEIQDVWEYLAANFGDGGWSQTTNAEIARGAFGDKKDGELVSKCLAWLHNAGMIDRTSRRKQWEFRFDIENPGNPKTKVAAQIKEFRELVIARADFISGVYIMEPEELDDLASLVFDGTGDWREKIRRWGRNNYIECKSPGQSDGQIRVEAPSWGHFDASGAADNLTAAVKRQYDRFNELQTIARAPASLRAQMLEKAISFDEQLFFSLITTKS